MRELAARERLILLCGRYEGIDERLVAAEVDEELSIGDYVLSGGELAAAVVVDAVARLQEGALNDASRQPRTASRRTGCWTARTSRDPVEHELGAGPDGADVGQPRRRSRRWRRQQALGRTWLRRPDLLDVGRLVQDRPAVAGRLPGRPRRASGKPRNP